MLRGTSAIRGWEGTELQLKAKGPLTCCQAANISQNSVDREVFHGIVSFRERISSQLLFGCQIKRNPLIETFPLWFSLVYISKAKILNQLIIVNEVLCWRRNRLTPLNLEMFTRSTCFAYCFAVQKQVQNYCAVTLLPSHVEDCGVSSDGAKFWVTSFDIRPNQCSKQPL